MSNTINRPTQARSSVTQVLDFAWGRDVFTASDVIEAESLSRATAIEAIDTLVAIDILKELPNARSTGEYRQGRPARRFQFDSSRNIVIGVDAGDYHLTARAVDLAGTEVAYVHRATSPAATPKDRSEQICRLVRDTLAESNRDEGAVLALCAGVPAPVSRDGHSPRHEEGFWERTNPDLISALSPYSTVVEVHNDATLAAIAEAEWGPARGVDNYIALLAGERFGAGVVVDGRPLFGAHGGVGETVFLDYVPEIGSAWGLGIILPSLASQSDPNQFAAAKITTSDTVDLSEAHSILQRAAHGDPDAQRLADEAGAILGLVVAILSSIYDPELVVICGDIAEDAAPLLPAAHKRAQHAAHLPSPTIATSTLGSDVVLRGATAQALRSARTIALPEEVARRLSQRPTS